LIFVATVNGTKNISKIVYFTVPLPIVLLFIMLFRVWFLDGSGDGREIYLTGENVDYVETLSNPSMWSEAVG